MLHIYDRATMAQALAHTLEPRLHTLLAERFADLSEELIDCTEYLVVQAGDTEADIVRHVGFSPLVEPIEGGRFGGRGFHPHWDYLVRHDGYFELIFTFGSSFAYVILIPDEADTLSELRSLCRRYEKNY